MKEQREVEENHLAQQPSQLLNNTHFCYEVKRFTNNYNEKKTRSWERKEWENTKNKLYYIKPCIEEWESTHDLCMQYELKLSRLLPKRRIEWQVYQKNIIL